MQIIGLKMERDNEINKKLLFMGWTVIRFWGKDILKNIDDCISVIEDVIWEQKMNQDVYETVDKIEY